jgi:IMP dehydrogenase
MGHSGVRELRRVYGFDEVAIVPGNITVNPEQADLDITIGGVHLDIPVLAAAMDAVVDPSFSGHISRLGGLGVMNLEGVQCRYDRPGEVIREIASGGDEATTGLLQKLYSVPIREELVSRRVEEMKAEGGVCAVSMTPAWTKRLAPAAVEAGADIVVVQSTVTTARHVSKSYRGLVFAELIEMVSVPIVVGNCVSYTTALELMETGIDGVLVGVGPGAACTTREVVGVGVPQVTATLDVAQARDEYYKRSGKYVTVITDGGIRTGGDLCKAIVAGADGVMIGTPFAQTKEAPGRGYNWGMASPHPALPRGVRIKVGTRATLEQVLFGPTSQTDGTQNLMGALKVCMGMCGAMSIRELHDAELVVAPAIRTEGKLYQMSGRK